MTIEYDPDSSYEDGEFTVTGWDEVAASLVITLLIASAGEEGLDEDILLTAFDGANPTEVLKMGLASIRKLVELEA